MGELVPQTVTALSPKPRTSRKGLEAFHPPLTSPLLRGWEPLLSKLLNCSNVAAWGGTRVVPVPEVRDVLLCWGESASPGANEGARDGQEKRSFIVKMANNILY